MKNLVLTLTLITLGFTSANAQWWAGSKKVSGNGNYTTETRNVSQFDEVALQGFFDVELISGKEGSLKVEAESNLQEHIRTEVSGGTLKISVEDGVNLHPSRNHKIKITVAFENIEGVSLTGSGDLYSSVKINAARFEASLTGSGNMALKLDAQTVEAKVVGSGDLELKGTAAEFNASVSGSGDLDASELKSQRASASITGSGDIQVNVSEALKSRVSGSGDIRYTGNPQKQDFRTAGSGSISGS